MKPQRLGTALCVLSACGFAGLAIFGKYAYDAGLNVPTLLALRFALAAACFWAIVVARRPRWPSRDVVLAGVALGAVGYAAQSGLFFSALERIDASLTSLLLYVYPALVFALAVALGREHATPRRVAALALALAGAALVLLGGGDTGALDGLGVGLALGAALAYTIYILVSDRVVARIDPFLLPALVCTGGAATFLAFGASTGKLDLGFEAVGWAHVAGIALVSTVLAISTFFAGLRLVGPATASIVSTAEPAMTVALAALLLGESLQAAQLAGGALVLGAVVVLNATAGSVPEHAAALEATPAPATRPAAQEPARG